MGKKAATFLAAGRIGAGIVGFLAPGIVERIYGAPGAGRSPLRFALRTFASRDLAMGVTMLSAGAEERRRWLTAGIVVDAADAAAGVIAGMRRQLPAPVAALIAVSATSAALLGLRARHDG